MSEQNKNSGKGKNAKKLAAEKAQRNGLFKTIGIVALVCAVIAAMIVLLVADNGAYNIDYSKGLTDDGKIEKVNVLDYIDAFEYKNMTAPLSEVMPSEEDIEEDIAMMLDSYKEYQEGDVENGHSVFTGDEVAVVYTMYVDGDPVPEESIEDSVDIVLGEGVYAFEEQLDGAVAGDSLLIDCTLPADYENEDVAGKTVTYDVQILGYYVVPELTDDFVKENLSDSATTADGYRDYVKQSLLDLNVEEYILNFLNESAKADKYPKKYLNILIDNADLDYRYMYEYYNSYYASIYGGYVWNGFYDFIESYYGQTRSEYEDQLETDMKEKLAYYMTIQYIFEDMGLEMSDEAIKEAYGYDDEDFAEAMEIYGRGDMARSAMERMVIDSLSDNIVLE